jgi:hypothetical protein
MGMGVVFRKIGGRIVPIFQKSTKTVLHTGQVSASVLDRHRITTGLAIIGGTSFAVNSIGNKLKQKIGQEKTESTHKAIGKFVVNFGVTSAALYAGQRYGGKRVRESIHAAFNMFGRAGKGVTP